MANPIAHRVLVSCATNEEAVRLQKSKPRPKGEVEAQALLVVRLHIIKVDQESEVKYFEVTLEQELLWRTNVG